MNETWIPITGYEGRYEVSSVGRVRSMRSGRIMKQSLLPIGYLVVNLCRDGKATTHYAHRLVAEAFHPHPGGDVEVCHGDGDRLNNAAANLRWGTRSDNSYDSVRHGTHFQASKTHCKRGHEFAPENTQWNSAGHRRCRTCTRANYFRSAA